MGSTPRKKVQKEITAAAAVAQFLGIPVSPWATSCRVAEVIQAVIDDLERQNENLKAANQLISRKHRQAVAQVNALRQATKKVENSSTAQTQATQETPEWGTKKPRLSRSRTQKKGEAA
ncbi:MAG: hypothetical protein H7Y37_18335 [Anaerolineae bacterium]|nr:hypothetical protein [Gloeobacterales cyanobacterium ES-bin-313]